LQRPSRRGTADRLEVDQKLLYSVRLRDTGQLAFLLLEHRSSEAWDMAERLLKYEVRQLGAWRRRPPHARQVPVVLGVVLYHGEEDWKAPLRLEAMMGLPLEEVQREGWRELLIHPEHVLGNLRRRSEEELLAVQGPPLVPLALVLLRFGRSGQLREKLLEWVPLFQQVYATPTGPEDLEASVGYVRVLGDERTDKVLRRVLSSLIPVRQAEELMQTVGQKIWQEGLLVGELRGEARGEASGEARGVAKGKAESVLRLLAARGIPVDDKSRHRILNCRELDLLDLWFDRALRATRLSDVLGEWAP
jgi:hypothetical protein